MNDSKQKWPLFLVILGICLLSMIELKAFQSTYVVTNDTITHQLNSHLLVVADPNNEETITSISGKLAQFIPFQEAVQKEWTKGTAYWGMLKIENQTNREHGWKLLTGGLDYATVYELKSDGTTEVMQSGRFMPYDEKHVKDRNIRICQFHLKLPAHETVSLYIKLHNPSELPLEFDVQLSTIEKWKATHYDEMFLQRLITGIFLGFLGIMFLYNALTYFLSRDKVYLYYSLYILGPLIYLLAYDGFFTTTFVGNSRVFYLYLRTLSPALSILFYLLFARKFLNLPKLMPTGDRVFKGLIIMEVTVLIYILCAVPLSMKESFYRSIPGVFHMLFFIVSFVIYILLLFKRNTLVNYFVFGALFYLVFSFIFGYIVLTKMYPLSTAILFGAIGLGVELVAFSLGLGYRIRLNEQEKLKAQEETAKILKEQNEVLEVRVKERTFEINKQKEEILTQNEELKQQQEEIISQRDYIENQNKDLIYKNEQITDSIRYAQTIQEAILPFTERIEEAFPNYFIIYKPKDIVSGDFYWMEEVEGKRMLAVVDCTGHGVPGAFMSIIGFSILNDEVLKKHLTSPATIMQQLHLTIKRALKQEEQANQDGMDLVFCVMEDLPEGKVKLTYAGAKRPLYYFRPQSNELVELKGDRRSIGGFQGKELPFTDQEIILEKGSKIYMTTDGFMDQHNMKGRKFGSLQFKKLLQEISELPMVVQKERLNSILQNHMNGQFQRDDITVIGVEL